MVQSNPQIDHSYHRARKPGCDSVPNRSYHHSKKYPLHSSSHSLPPQLHLLVGVLTGRCVEGRVCSPPTQDMAVQGGVEVGFSTRSAIFDLDRPRLLLGQQENCILRTVFPDFHKNRGVQQDQLLPPAPLPRAKRKGLPCNAMSTAVSIVYEL